MVKFFKALKKFFSQSDFDLVVDTGGVPALGVEANIVPTEKEGEPFKAVLLDRLTSGSMHGHENDKSLLGGASYFRTIKDKKGSDGKDLGVQFKASRGYYELNETCEGGKTLAFCNKDKKENIVIFGFVPFFEGQESTGEHKGRPLYPYYVFIDPKDGVYASYKVALANKPKEPVYTIHQGAALLKADQHIVRYKESPCAFINDPKGKGSFDITVNPGVDPLLIIFLAALCIKFDTNEVAGNIFERFGKELAA